MSVLPCVHRPAPAPFFSGYIYSKIIGNACFTWGDGLPGNNISVNFSSVCSMCPCLESYLSSLDLSNLGCQVSGDY